MNKVKNINGIVIGEGEDSIRTLLENANLKKVDFWGADLERADLKTANLKNAKLKWANLRGVDFRWANLRKANFRWANLEGANLEETNLMEVDFYGANLKTTCLDPGNKPNSLCSGFKRDEEFIIGYRTKTSPVVNGEGYKEGATYVAPYFSTATTECHPGLYLCPSLYLVKMDHPDELYIKVWAKSKETHRAGNKWRCKKFYKVEEINT